MSEDSTKVGWQPDGSFWGDDDDYEQWVSEHPDEAQEEDNQENESGFDADLGSYVSKQLLNDFLIKSLWISGTVPLWI